jgi:hypothetical protein
VSPTPAERERLAAQSHLTRKQIGAITKRLDKLDAQSDVGPWTRRTLELIAQQPGVVSSVLAKQVRRDRYTFKALILELRDLGLTFALDVGWCLSPRGRAYLKASAD